MKTLIVAILLATSAFAQNWEVGFAGGMGGYPQKTVTGVASTGEYGFHEGYAFGAVAGNDMYRHVGGELRYTYRKDNLQFTSGGVKVTVPGESHAVHYDMLVHARSKEASIRPFLALGAGVKFYRGRGQGSSQPLGSLIFLSAASQNEPLLSAGGGVKFAVSRRFLFRVDFRDYATPFPNHLFVRSANARAGGWMHDLVGLLGLSATF